MIEIRRYFGTAAIFDGEDLQAAGIKIRIGVEIDKDSLMPKYEYWTIPSD